MNVGEPEQAAALVAMLRDLESGPRTLAAVIALGASAVPALEDLLRGRSESVSQPRRLAAAALGRIGGPCARAALRRGMQDSLDRALDPVLQLSEDEVQAEMADAMGLAPAPEDADVLLRALRRRANPSVARTLGRMREANAIPLLVRCLADASAVDPARDALATLGPLAIPALTALAVACEPEACREGASSVRARARAVDLLGRIGGSATDLPLAWALSDPHRDVRLSAALALARRGPRESSAAIDVLLEALADERWYAAEEASAALIALGGLALRDLRRRMRREADVVRERGVRILRWIPHRSATMALVRLAGDASARVRLAVADALEGRDGDAVRRALERLAADTEPAVRMRAWRALGLPPAVPPEMRTGLLARWRVLRERRRRGART